jgi:hypothetical protein
MPCALPVLIAYANQLTRAHRSSSRQVSKHGPALTACHMSGWPSVYGTTNSWKKMLKSAGVFGSAAPGLITQSAAETSQHTQRGNAWNVPVTNILNVFPSSFAKVAPVRVHNVSGRLRLNKRDDFAVAEVVWSNSTTAQHTNKRITAGTRHFQTDH